jgi:hypothetical protein
MNTTQCKDVRSNNMMGNQPVDYGYLNMDTEEFVPSYSDLMEQMSPGCFMRSASNHYGQVLYAAGRRDFSVCEMMIKCRRLTGVLRGND